MMVTVETVYIRNIKTKTIPTKDVGYTENKWIGDNDSNEEKCNANYIKKELKL